MRAYCILEVYFVVWLLWLLKDYKLFCTFQCSVSCGSGRKVREVTCQSQTTRGSVHLPDSMCQHQPDIDKIAKCQMPRCPPVITHQWIVSSWAMVCLL